MKKIDNALSISEMLILKTSLKCLSIYYITEPLSVELSSEELPNARLCLVFNHQRKHYAEEFRIIRENAKLDADKRLPLLGNSSLMALKPILIQGLLRVGGRLSQTDLDPNVKHPLILQANDHLVRLLIEDTHLRVLHGSVQATLIPLRQEFWIVRGRQIVSSVISHCLRCKRYLAVTKSQEMGNELTSI